LTTIKLTEADVQNCQWTVIGFEDGYRVSIGEGTHPVTGVPITVKRREPVFEDQLLKRNAEERNSRDTKRWDAGAGSEKGGNVPMVRVARTPLNKFFSELAPRLKQGDKDFHKWWLGRSENQPFRTRSGNL